MKFAVCATILICHGSLLAAVEPVAESPLVTSKTPGHRVSLSADLDGAQNLYLVITSGGDGINCDWADWIAPQVSGPQGTLALADLKWKSATSEWGQVRKGRNAGNGPLRVDGKAVAAGIGAHATSVIHFEIPAGFDQFETECGLDNGGTDQGHGATVKFLVFTEPPTSVVDADINERTPETALAPLDSPDDLEATLLAAEPVLLSPSTIDVDHRGRIWVCEVVNYRRFANKERKDREEGDRILILEDTDGDGKVDSSRTFYQGRDVDSAHGICVLGNRVIVSALDSVINFYDDDGDLLPDRKEVMFTGIQGAQHDHGIHSFTFGPDGRLYFNFGNAGKELHRPDGTIVTDIAGKEVKSDRRPYQEGMAFRCDLDGSNVETLGWNFRNNWELAVDSFGTIWQSDNDDDGNRATRINYVMEYGNYGYRDELTGAGWRTPRTGQENTIPERHWHLNDPGVVPNLIITGAGAPCGIEVYEASLLPKRFHNQLLHCDAGVNVVRSYAVTADGAGYKASINPILTGTRDRWFRPCDVSIAADGSLIIADWYDPGVGGHRQGDVDRGRLFRVAPPGVAWRHPEFDFSTIDGAIQGLMSCNRDARYQSWQKLASAGASAEQALQQVYENHADPRMRARALWLLARIDGRADHYINDAVVSDHADLRIVALRLARQLQVLLPETIERLSGDSSPAVRRECVLALCNLPPDARVPLWTTLARGLPEGDRWYLEALGIAAHGIWDECLTAFLDSADEHDVSRGIREGVIWRSRAQATPQLLTKQIKSWAESKTSPRAAAYWFRALDFQNPAAVHRAVMPLVNPALLASMEAPMAKLIAGESLARLQPDLLGDGSAVQEELNTALDHVDEPQRPALIERLQLTERYPELLAMVLADPESQQAVSAVQSLLKVRQKDMLAEVLHGESPEQSVALLTAIGRSRNAALHPELLDLIDSEDADADVRRAAVRAGMKIPKTAQKIVQRTADERIDDSLRQTVAAALHNSSEAKLRQIGRDMFPLPEGKAGEKLPSIQKLMEWQGDAKNGRLVFNTTGTCHKCHVVNKIGRHLGPDLSEVGRKLSRQAMLESVLFPSAGISHNYDAWTLLLVNGTTMTGLIASETDDEIVLIDNEAVRHTVATDDIDEKIRQSVSLMPADLQKIMTPQELVDVVAYLETLKEAAK